MSSKRRPSTGAMDVDVPEKMEAKKKVAWSDSDGAKKEVKTSKAKSGTESFMDLFWHLANSHPDVRVQATATLIETLLGIEKKGSGSAQTKNGFHNISDELDYTLGRLVKGLLSSRDAARPGFATALSEVRFFTLRSSLGSNLEDLNSFD